MAQKPIDYVKSALRRLHLSDNEQAIYLSLLQEGEASARTLAARTAITRPSVYDQIKTLKTLGLVNTFKRENTKHFAAADVKHLAALLEDRIDRMEQSRDALQTALPSLAESLKTVDPKVRWFEGPEGVKQLLKDLMWHDHITLEIIWPHDHMQLVFDETFLRWFDDRRQKRRLTANVLWSGTDADPLFSEPCDTKRTLPKSASIPMATIIFNTKVAHISSIGEAFGFIVESNEYVFTQRAQFAALWQQAK